MIESLDVILWDRKVGTLVSSKKGYGQQVCFYFDPGYVENGHFILVIHYIRLQAIVIFRAVRLGLN